MFRKFAFLFGLFLLAPVTLLAADPPRLRVYTVEEPADGQPALYKGPLKGPTILKVRTVATTGLGRQMGLKSGDVFESIKLNEGEVWKITNSEELTNCLTRIMEATEKNPKSPMVDVTIKLRGEKTIKGTIIRSNARDRVDGKTLYYFESRK